MTNKQLIKKLTADISKLVDIVDEKNNTIERLSLDLDIERSEHQKQINQIKEMSILQFWKWKN